MNQSVDTGFADVLTAIEEEGWDSSTVTIRRFDPTVKGPSGIQDKSNPAGWSDLDGHIGLAAMVAADIYMTNVTRSTERRTVDTIMESDSLHILLMGLYPSIQKKDRALIERPNSVDGDGGTEFDIIGAEPDSQAVMTRLEVRRVK